MRISAVYTLPAELDVVFVTLTDPRALKECIPGCERLETVNEGEIAAVLKVGIAGLKGTYTGTARISDQCPPRALILAFDGKGAPGFVKGSANLRLSASEGGARVECNADVQVGGAIMAVGSRLIQAAAGKMMDDFMKRLSAKLDGTEAE